MIANDIIKLLNEFAPLKLQDSWDNSGFQIGSKERRVKSILLALEINKHVIEEAIENNIDMIITHHPLFFDKIKRIDKDTPKGKMIYDLLFHDISVFTAHTNLDATIGGVSDVLAKTLNLKNIEVLKKTHHEKLYKIVVFVPKDYSKKVREAMTKAGAGHIGNYSHCTFNTQGVGTFMPRENTNPFVGTKDTLEKVEEIRIETIVTEYSLNKVLKEMKKTHPYEEVAYDIYPLENSGKTYGFGRVGELDKKTNLKDFALFTKKTLNCDKIRVYGNIDKKIKSVVVSGGSGGDFIDDVSKANVDVYVTGDIDHHDAQRALELDLCIIDATHFHTEKLIMNEIKKIIESNFTNEKLNIKISQRDNSSRCITY